MVTRGHAHRVANAEDGRSSLIELTDEGQAVHELARSQIGDAHGGLARHLRQPAPDVRDTLARLAASLQDALDER
jgi:DNA-binding MarR family transcriptional regulator